MKKKIKIVFFCIIYLFIFVLVLEKTFVKKGLKNHYFYFSNVLSGNKEVKGEPTQFFFNSKRKKFFSKCPANAILIATFGQSNSANYLDYKFKEKSFYEKKNLIKYQMYNFYDNECYFLSDPVLGATGKAGSMWPTLAYKLNKKLDMPIIIIAGGSGGTSSDQWLDRKYSYMENLKTSIQQIWYKHRIKPKYFIFHQGETDGLLNTKKEKYFNNLVSIFTELNVLNDSYTTILIFGVSKCEDRESNNEIIYAQKKLAESFENVFYIYNTDKLGKNYRGHDNCHFNYNGIEFLTEKITQNILTIEKN